MCTGEDTTERDADEREHTAALLIASAARPDHDQPHEVAMLALAAGTFTRRDVSV